MSKTPTSDPLMIGMIGLGEPSSRSVPVSDQPTVEYDAPSNPVTDKLLDAIGRQHEPVIETQSEMSDDSSPERQGSSSPFRPWSGEVPEGAILSSQGLVFTDFDAAKHKADAMWAQTNETFIVQALSGSDFVVVPLKPSSKGTSSTVESLDSSSPNSTEPTVRDYHDIPVDQQKLSDFPPDHPVHKFGLAKYKRYFKKNFKFKPAYRSMLMLLSLIPIGLLAYMFPNRALLLLPQESVQKMMETIPVEQLASGISTFGLVLAVVAALRIFWMRHFHRYTLKPNYVEYAEGIFMRKTSKIPYRNILNHECHQNPIQLFLNYGTLELASAASDGAEILIRNVLNPQVIEIILEDNINKAQFPG